MDTRLSYLRLSLEVHGAETAQGRVPTCGIVEALDVVEHVCLCMIGVRYILRPFSEKKKLSIAALSQTCPTGSSSRRRRYRPSAAGTARSCIGSLRSHSNDAAHRRDLGLLRLGPSGAAGRRACRAARSPSSAHR